MSAAPSQWTSNFVLDLTKHLHHELSQLSKQDEALRRLIHRLNFLLRESQKTAKRQASKSLTKPLNSPNSVIELHKNTFSAGTSPPGKISTSDQKLRRACRIALMETEEGASVAEICLRILRRGSFPFKDPDHAREVITHTLTAMAREGDAVRPDTNSWDTDSSNNDECSLWKRTTGDHEA